MNIKEIIQEKQKKENNIVAKLICKFADIAGIEYKTTKYPDGKIENIEFNMEDYSNGDELEKFYNYLEFLSKEENLELLIKILKS